MSPSFTEWTAGESNPDHRRAIPVSFRWTSSPKHRSGPAGELNPDLLVAGQASYRWTSRPFTRSRGPPGNRTRSTSLPRRRAAGNTCGPNMTSRPGRTRTCAILFVRQASSPLDDGTNEHRSSTGGIRTHTHQNLILAAIPVSVPCRDRDSCGSGSRTPPPSV